MSLPNHLACKIDYLIPDEIIAACELDRFDVEVVFTGTSKNNLYPWVRIWIDNIVCWDNVVVGQTKVKISHKLNISNPCVNLIIERYEVSADNHTSNDHSVLIEQLIINDIDIVKNNIINNFGYYHSVFDSEKKEYYIKNKLSTEPTHSLNMNNIGKWDLVFETPIMRSIAKIVAPQRTKNMKWPDNDLLIKIVETCDRIIQLEKTKLIKQPRSMK